MVIFLIFVVGLIVGCVCCKSSGLREKAAEKAFRDLKRNKTRK